MPCEQPKYLHQLREWYRKLINQGPSPEKLFLVKSVDRASTAITAVPLRPIRVFTHQASFFFLYGCFDVDTAPQSHTRTKQVVATRRERQFFLTNSTSGGKDRNVAGPCMFRLRYRHYWLEQAVYGERPLWSRLKGGDYKCRMEQKNKCSLGCFLLFFDQKAWSKRSKFRSLDLQGIIPNRSILLQPFVRSLRQPSISQDEP